MFTLDDLLKATNGKVLSEGNNIFTSASIDTRTIGESEIFFALKGSKRDGHEFLEEALRKSSGAVISKDIDIDFNGKTVIKVDDTFEALKELAKYLREKFKGKVIAVVGSNGKTTTKELLYHFLSEKYKVLKTEGNFNNIIGVPLCISKIKHDTEIMVLELGTNRKGDIRELCEIVNPQYALITNIGYEHIEGFGSLEGVRDGELEVLPFVHTVFANGDDPFLMEGFRYFQGKVITFGIGENCEYKASDINFLNDHVEFVFHADIASFPINISLVGLYNVYNTVAAATVAVNWGISKCSIKKAAEAFAPVKMRGEIIKVGDFEIFFDAYNANPSSMKVALQELSRRKKGKPAVAVLGDMLELGDFSEHAHEQLGMWIRDFGIEHFIGVGKFIKNALRYVNGKIFDTVEEAGEFINRNFKGPYLLLIKGSRAMKMEKILEIIKKGN